MSGAILPLPNTPSWRGAQFKKHRDSLILTFTSRELNSLRLARSQVSVLAELQLLLQYFIPDTTKRICMKFGHEDVRWTLSVSCGKLLTDGMTSLLHFRSCTRVDNEINSS